MKKTDFPLKKTYEKTFTLWERSFVLKYEQATIAEYHEFFAKSHGEQIQELYQEIQSQIQLSTTEKILSFIFQWYRWSLERSMDMDKELIEVMENKFRTYKSVYEEVNQRKSWGSKQSSKSLYSANLSIVCQKYCIDPFSLFKNFTLEQYMWLQDWVVFIANESDKEGKMENQLALIDKEEVKKRAEETRKAFESN